MARACGAEDFAALEDRLSALQRAAAQISEDHFQEH
jgi:hypothetical protein